MKEKFSGIIILLLCDKRILIKDIKNQFELVFNKNLKIEEEKLVLNKTKEEKIKELESKVINFNENMD